VIENVFHHHWDLDAGESLNRERSECLGYYLDEPGTFAMFIGLPEGLLMAGNGD